MTTSTVLSESQAHLIVQEEGCGQRNDAISELSKRCAQTLASQIEILRQLGIAVRVLSEGARRACEAASTNALWVEGTASTARDMVVEVKSMATAAAQSHAASACVSKGRAGHEVRQFAALSRANAALSETAKGIERIGHQLDLMALQSSMDAARAESGPAMWSAVLAQIECLSKTLNSIDLPPDLHS